MSKQKSSSNKRETLAGRLWRRFWLLLMGVLSLYFGVNAVVLLFDALADGRSLRWIITRELLFVIPFVLSLQQFLKVRRKD